MDTVAAGVEEYLVGTTTFEKLEPPLLERITAISIRSATSTPGSVGTSLVRFSRRKLTKTTPFVPTAMLGCKACTLDWKPEITSV